jgi:uncharacterized protein (TIGR02265 family)
VTADRPIPGRLVKAVFQRVLASDLTPDLVQQLHDLGVDVGQPARDNYDREVWHSAVDAAALALFPSASPDAALRQLGSYLIETMQAKHLVRGPWLGMAKLLGPRRAMKQVAEHAASVSPVEFAVIEHGKTDLEVRVDEERQPTFLAGIVEGMVTILGGRDVMAEVVSLAQGRTVMRVTWR